jgi:hypothetical protein
LLIDELNNLKALGTDMDKARDCAEFLKEVFVSRENRYLVFSSHVVTTTTQLSSFMESFSSRRVEIRALPLVPTLSEAVKNFDWADLNARHLLYYGIVPALVYTGRRAMNAKSQEHVHPATQKREEAVEECLKNKLVTDETILKLLRSMLKGTHGLVPRPLLQLMNTVEGNLIHWIPFHMVPVLERFAEEVDRSLFCREDLRTLLLRVVELFQNFMSAKKFSGDGWESLFLIVLLIRCVTGLFHATILPFENIFERSGCPVFYNDYIDLNDIDYDDIQKVDELIRRMKPPEHSPCIVVYYPQNSAFETYDVLVAAYTSPQSRKTTRRRGGRQSL